MKNFLGKCSRRAEKKGNVMTPLNWMCGTFVPSLLYVFSKNHDNWAGYYAAFIVAAILVFYCLVYTYFGIKAPDRLQSEQYNIESQEILYYHGKPGHTYIESQTDAQPCQLAETKIQSDNNS